MQKILHHRPPIVATLPVLLAACTAPPLDRGIFDIEEATKSLSNDIPGSQSHANYPNLDTDTPLITRMKDLSFLRVSGLSQMLLHLPKLGELLLDFSEEVSIADINFISKGFIAGTGKHFGNNKTASVSGTYRTSLVKADSGESLQRLVIEIKSGSSFKGFIELVQPTDPSSREAILLKCAFSIDPLLGAMFGIPNLNTEGHLKLEISAGSNAYIDFKPVQDPNSQQTLTNELKEAFAEYGWPDIILVSRTGASTTCDDESASDSNFARETAERYQDAWSKNAVPKLLFALRLPSKDGKTKLIFRANVLSADDHRVYFVPDIVPILFGPLKSEPRLESIQGPLYSLTHEEFRIALNSSKPPFASTIDHPVESLDFPNSASLYTFESFQSGIREIEHLLGLPKGFFHCRTTSKKHKHIRMHAASLTAPTELTVNLDHNFWQRTADAESFKRMGRLCALSSLETLELLGSLNRKEFLDADLSDFVEVLDPHLVDSLGLAEVWDTVLLSAIKGDPASLARGLKSSLFEGYFLPSLERLAKIKDLVPSPALRLLNATLERVAKNS